ncbi:hypothetical protein SEUCBS140593_006352 [Sporothrix eucalyptigena]|uniref:Major facilitator superfamily (MFS) profile domain-containing protein n=1 Tax=Sporothrix eucalyptigena TaxID=1812306 RepID=A0ABP0C435_9PEZI
MLRSLASIRALPIDDPTVVDEAKEIRDYDNWSVEHGSVTLWNIFTSKRYFKRLFHAFIPFLAMQFSGIGFLTIYAAVIYEKLGLTTQHAALLLNACTQILYAIAALEAREIGVGMANVIPIAIGVALGQEWPTASDKLGAKSYIILLCTSAVGSALVWYFVVEPKGVSIEHVDVLFGETDHVEDFRHEMEEKVHITTKE